jgi:hypothetical protein
MLSFSNLKSYQFFDDQNNIENISYFKKKNGIHHLDEKENEERNIIKVFEDTVKDLNYHYGLKLWFKYQKKD